MKKFISIVAAILIIAVAVLTIKDSAKKEEVVVPAETMKAEEMAGTEETPAQEAAESIPAPKRVDYEALYQAYKPDEIVATVEGKDITWNEMYGWISYYASNIEQTMVNYANYYGYQMTWEDAVNEQGNTFADSAIEQACDYMKQVYSVLTYADANGIKIEDADQQVADAFLADAASILGENATAEDFEQYLIDAHMSREQYETILKFNLYYEEIYQVKYGKDAEYVSDEDALQYLEDNGYFYANHILFMTNDPMNETGLTEEEVKLAYENAVKISEELRAIEDHDELVAKFLELKQEYDEDTGKVRYPNGYLFTSGEMVESFEKAVAEAEAYEVTEPVESNYGYHVIIRLPLDPDVVIPSQSKTARQIVADKSHAEFMQSNYENAKAEVKEVLSQFNLMDYIK